MKTKLFLFLLALFMPFASFVAAEEEKPLPQTGLLAGVGNLRLSQLEIPKVWGKPNPPLIGTVSFDTRRGCTITVENISKVTYDIRVEARQFTADGRRVGDSRHTYLLRPGQRAERTVPRRQRSNGCSLWLLSWSTR